MAMATNQLIGQVRARNSLARATPFWTSLELLALSPFATRERDTQPDWHSNLSPSSIRVARVCYAKQASERTRESIFRLSRQSRAAPEVLERNAKRASECVATGALKKVSGAPRHTLKCVCVSPDWTMLVAVACWSRSGGDCAKTDDDDHDGHHHHWPARPINRARDPFLSGAVGVQMTLGGGAPSSRPLFKICARSLKIAPALIRLVR